MRAAAAGEKACAAGGKAPRGRGKSVRGAAPRSGPPRGDPAPQGAGRNEEEGPVPLSPVPCPLSRAALARAPTPMRDSKNLVAREVRGPRGDTFSSHRIRGSLLTFDLHVPFKVQSSQGLGSLLQIRSSRTDHRTMRQRPSATRLKITFASFCGARPCPSIRSRQTVSGKCSACNAYTHIHIHIHIHITCIHVVYYHVCLCMMHFIVCIISYRFMICYTHTHTPSLSRVGSGGGRDV